MSNEFAASFAAQWASDWNRHDIDALLEHFADDVVWTSPVAERLGVGEHGVIRGKEQLRDYYRKGVQLIPNLSHTVVGVYAGVDTIVINFRNQEGRLVNEVLRFRNGLVVEGHGTYLQTEYVDS